VNIDDGEEVVRQIKPLVRQTFTPGAISDIGAFGAFYELDTFDFKRPVLVSSVDGVGTKLKVAIDMDIYSTVGQCLVNHCVNDILVCGAKPLYFLDYYACGKLFVSRAVDVIKGMTIACTENDCALIGGETAEMPGVYQEADFDLAGTIVGVVEKEKILTGKSIISGDVMIALPSTGLHTNGYSLARKILSGKYHDPLDGSASTVGNALLQIHRSYFKLIYPMLSQYELKGLSHITGGGLVGNTMRVVPKGLELRVDWSAWKRLPIFDLIQKEGDVPEADMRRTFNLGIGLIVIVSKNEADRISAHLKTVGESHYFIGEIAAS
jgi:phosphoribosylformylglycinamidine cyclo-ligase